MDRESAGGSALQWTESPEVALTGVPVDASPVGSPAITPKTDSKKPRVGAIYCSERATCRLVQPSEAQRSSTLLLLRRVHSIDWEGV